ncbi:MAG: molybdopterin molybdotransferase MoeA [Deltaproteobacteria bacterium]|nr:molybdopterin molybdotransferase MoeA [Deltaproteobacteria bacterium]
MREAGVEAERSSVGVAEARELILAALPALGAESVGLERATGRVLAEEIRAQVRIPPEDNSAMDGYALRAADASSAPSLLRVVDDLPAGRRSLRAIGPGEAARIMTGAAIPEGADAVVMIEDTATEGDRVRVRRAVAAGQHIRRAGSDVDPGTLVASPGDRLRPPLVGMLAALGRSQLLVRARPRVAVLATGDELVEPDRLRDDGRIASSNSYTLAAGLREIGAEPVYLGIAPDDPDAIAARLREALRCDAVISTGGVSVGDHDWIKQVLTGLGGEMRLWRIRMRPGAPLAFATVGGRPIFALPGNPVSTLVTFEQFVRPGLLRMMGHRRVYRPVEPAVLDESYEKPAGRAHFVRVVLERRADGLHARPTGEQASNILLSMVRADALAFVAEDLTHLPVGSRVPVQLLHSDDLREEPGL